MSSVCGPDDAELPIFDREMPPGFTPTSCFCHNFVYISTLRNLGDISLDQNFQNIDLYSHANFREKLSKDFTARPQKPKLSEIPEQYFQDGGCPTCTWMWTRAGASATRVLVLPKMINMNILKTLYSSTTPVLIFQYSYSYVQYSPQPWCGPIL